MNNLDEIFTTYQHWTGVYIDPYKNMKLTMGNQETLIKIIDMYIDKTNINLNKQKTVDILEFRALIKYCIKNNWTIKILGD